MTQSIPDLRHPPLGRRLRRRLRRMLAGVRRHGLIDACYRAPAGAADRVLSLGPIERRTNSNLRARVALAAGRERMDDVDQLYEFWRQESPDGNFFTALASSTRSETVLCMMDGLLDPSCSILEVGCNVGRNLHHFWGRGFRNLAGIEVSQAAVRRLRDSYPDLGGIPVMVGPAELLLPGLPAASYDLVFTMAVLEHIHPSQSRLFSEIARASRKYVLAIEPRVGHATHRQYPWDVVRCYEEAGLRVLRHASWRSLWSGSVAEDPEWSYAFDDYDAWLFEHAGGSRYS